MMMMMIKKMQIRKVFPLKKKYVLLLWQSRYKKKYLLLLWQSRYKKKYLVLLW